MNSEYLAGLAGGICIGLASFVASAATGKIPGISGVFGRLLLMKPGDTAWRFVFLVGLIAGAVVAFAAFDPSYHPVRSLGVVAVAGALVGLGTRLGGGCTSGHGVCGIGLGARDSVIATVIFMAAGMAAVYVVDHLLGGIAR
jgi:uncharacterized membrane protein YedE/YeeE